MSQRIQVVLPDPATRQLRELAAAADTPPSTLAAQLVRSGLAQVARTGRSGHCAPHLCSSVTKAASVLGGLSPTAATANGARRCGAQSSRYTAATPNNSKHSKTNGGTTNHKPRHYPRSPHGEPNSTTPAKTPAKSSPSKTNSPTTLKSYASKAAASQRHGSQGHRQTNGPDVFPRHQYRNLLHLTS